MITFKRILTERLKSAIKNDLSNVSFYHGSHIPNITKFELGKDAVISSVLGGNKFYKSTMMFFTSNKDVAIFFAKNRWDYYRGFKTGRDEVRATVYEVKLNVHNVLDLTKKTTTSMNVLREAGFDVYEYFGVRDYLFGTFYDWQINSLPASYFNYDSSDLNTAIPQKKDVCDNLKRMGYDGIMFRESEKRGFSIAVFDVDKINIVNSFFVF